MGSIIIVDDHPLIRLAIRTVLEPHEHNIVAEADNGADAVQLVRKHLPDLLILDLNIPNLDGFSVISHIKSAGLPIKTLVLTSSNSKNFALRCLQAGAAGFLCKNDNLNELANAVKAILSGYSYFPEDTISTLQQNTNAACQESVLIAQLTDREITVLKLLASGLNNQKIADALLISHKTVSTYKVRLLKRFNVSNLVALAELAKRNSVV
ncbi:MULTISPECIES: response regulator transcription factor [Pseudomonas]|jgi:Response regulator containing a CheY-like receiver domain and an HTH DNA-binding domain|uniref:DNA-binding response regulator n=4 Tax=Pseudomonas chlororaphis TaxID=587753 RepID=A0A0E1E8E6_9PSED|nr:MULTISPECIES: response regulator transcription factor [Pseudomonas]AIC21420.1 LuxR family transcriptional regulator [Pseudomonas chlororaphis]AIS11913.1 LuxR family transcriptional regulator [Pseudomonas chlororaphis subsp. aurantiaca]AMS16843.1 DNA-binding response regulator [Pseudomonas chlororaphis]AUG03450.1 DNA-binding response regulator [Pseudomonas sp. 09C 129]AUG42304.1 DNA-binding response regulator [Pseudomonas chlororaphis]